MDGLSVLIAMFLAGGVMTEGYAPTKADLTCMAANIWHEAQGEDTLGRIGVAQTVRNRIRDARNDDGVILSPCEVIWTRGAFSWTYKHRNNKFVFKESEMDDVLSMLEISVAALDGQYDGMLSGSVMYYNPEKVTPCWEDAYDEFIDIGNHRWALNPNGTTPCWNKRTVAQAPSL